MQQRVSPILAAQIGENGLDRWHSRGSGGQLLVFFMGHVPEIPRIRQVLWLTD